MIWRPRVITTIGMTIGLPMTCAFAAERHVATGGNDSNPGTAESPWRSVQKAASSALPGDVVNIHAGTYAERVTMSNRGSASGNPITFRKNLGDAGVVVISQTGVTPPSGLSAVLMIENCHRIVLQDLEVADYKTSGTAAAQRAQLPAGIYIRGACTGLSLSRCKVHDIWQSSPTLNNFDANGFGIAAYGDNASPIDGLVIDSCEVYNLRTGASESVVLNGNVTNFSVTNNTVRDCNNIGIDFIGFEGTAPTEALDQARSGICRGNTVYRIDSKYNPVYGGNFTTGGNNNTRSAPGIYVDGGKDILIERNHVYDCNYALSAGSENTGKLVSNVTVRNNILHHCHVGGIVVGGSEASNGGVTNSSFTHNTIYDNDTVAQGGGQFSIQNHVSAVTIRRNLMVSTAQFAQFILKDNTTGSMASGAVDWNLYKTPAGGDIEFIWNGSAKSTFAAWQTVSGDAHSTLTSAALGLAVAAPTVASAPSDFMLTASSPAKDSGDSAALPFTPSAGEKDYFGDSRVAGGRVDIGADEFLTPLQGWRDQHFSLPDGGIGAASEDDPDHDGAMNLIEYSQGMNPTLMDRGLLPAASKSAGVLRFTYLKSAPELTYAVETSSGLSAWSPALPAEQSSGGGVFYRDFPIDGAMKFVRLRVSSPVPW